MITSLVVLVFVTILSVVSYISKRRFGTLAMAMAAGFIISSYEAQPIASLLNDYDVSFGVMSLTTAVSIVIILLPSILLFFGGPTYSTKRHRLIGSIAYGITALFFCLGALEHSLVLIGQEKVVYSYIQDYREQAIVFLLIVAVFDMFFIHAIRKQKRAE